ncbi:amidohydrolase [Bacillus timonensis]|uniref:Amidohydrolase n=1 Tax=Bacillus timonensis TaxID=1033734 RepID=A0A4S3PQR2_9BACI|nr:amidohydrolase [Bacillus timonensis]THE11092.1 amidohydrolase [Bacillus timonensis]
MKIEAVLSSLDMSIMEWIDQNKSVLFNASTQIWNFAELGLKEYKSSKLLVDLLKEEGFSIEMGVGGMPTAFVATWGEGKPVIGILGEYDALPGLSQKVSGIKDQVENGGNGHGCGHNIFGVAGVGAAIAVKNAMEVNNIKGTIKFFGCPAEEILVGKVYMVRDGVFEDVDACLTWHPGAVNSLWASSSLAANSVKFTFHGKASHAATNPESGRSALKAVQLMDIGVQFLREHIIDSVRIHSTITVGGQEPNVIPDKAQIWYYIRAPIRKEVDEIYNRIVNIAKGAALMTETNYEIDFLTACYNMIPNKVIGNLLMENMKKVGPPKFDANDRKLADELVSSFGQVNKETVLKVSGAPLELVQFNLNETIVEPYDEGKVLAGSTDVADVSWNVPTAQFNTACVPIGTPVHSWQFVSAVGSGIGQKGMLMASKILGLSAMNLLTNNKLLFAAKEEFESEIKRSGKYKSPLPANIIPPFDHL